MEETRTESLIAMVERAAVRPTSPLLAARMVQQKAELTWEELATEWNMEVRQLAQLGLCHPPRNEAEMIQVIDFTGVSREILSALLKL